MIHCQIIKAPSRFIARPIINHHPFPSFKDKRQNLPPTIRSKGLRLCCSGGRGAERDGFFKMRKLYNRY